MSKSSHARKRAKQTQAPDANVVHIVPKEERESGSPAILALHEWHKLADQTCRDLDRWGHEHVPRQEASAGSLLLTAITGGEDGCPVFGILNQLYYEMDVLRVAAEKAEDLHTATLDALVYGWMLKVRAAMELAERTRVRPVEGGAS